MQYKHRVSILVVVALFLELLDGGIIHVAMPTLQRQFALAPSAVHWVSTAYVLAIALLIPASAYAADRFGVRATMLLALGLFGLGSLGCVLSASFAALVAARVLQGVGGGLMSPLGSTLLMRAYPSQERAQAAGLMMVPSLVAPALAPWVGGYLVQYHSWRWIFAINLPVMVMALGLAYLWLRQDDALGQAVPFDWLGMLASGAGLALLCYALSDTAQSGRAAPLTLAAGCAGALALAGSVRWFLRSRVPLLDVRLFCNTRYRSGSGLQFLLIGGLCGSLFTLVLCQQQALGKSPLAAGAVSSAQAAGIMAAVSLAGRFGHVVGRWTLICWGLFVYTLTTCLVSWEPVLGNTFYLALTLVGRGTGLGCCLSLTWVEAFSEVPSQKMAQASALINAMVQLGNATGVALAAAFLSWRARGVPAGSLTLFGQALACFAAVAAMCWLVGLLTHQRLSASRT